MGGIFIYIYNKNRLQMKKDESSEVSRYIKTAQNRLREYYAENEISSNSEKKSHENTIKICIVCPYMHR